ncbi:hypothetical protein BH09PAT4_BH09PAT4_05500 [soil metagenome]
MELEIENLNSEWNNKYPGYRPVAEELRNYFPDRWIRFHSLAGSERYPQTDDDYATILNRNNALLEELEPGASIVVVISAWIDSTNARPNLKEMPEAIYWQTLDPVSDESNTQGFRQLYAARLPWKSGALNELLRSVADDQTAGVIIAPDDLRWLYHPYDGGVDIIVGSEAERNELKDRHQEWLSPRPDGL